MVLLVYVDDIVVTGTSSSVIDKAIQSINKEFNIKELGSLNYFLVMKVTATENYLLLHQKKYIHDLFKKVGLTDVSSFPTPMTCTCLTKLGMAICSEPLIGDTLYRSTMCALQHGCITWPNIIFMLIR